MRVPAGSHSGSGDDVVFVLDVNHPSLPTHFYFVVVSIPVFVALSTVFHSINPPHNSLLSHSVLPVFFSPLFVLSTIHLFMKVYLALI